MSGKGNIPKNPNTQMSLAVQMPSTNNGYLSNTSYSTDKSMLKGFGSYDNSMLFDNEGSFLGFKPKPGLSGFEKFSLGANAITGLMGAYNAYQQLRLLKDQYRASLADRNQQIANQAAITNLNLRNQASIAAQMSNLIPGTQEYENYLRDNTVQVDGSPIKG